VEEDSPFYRVRYAIREWEKHHGAKPGYIRCGARMFDAIRADKNYMIYATFRAGPPRIELDRFEIDDVPILFEGRLPPLEFERMKERPKNG
jgi:hypothetical protein